MLPASILPTISRFGSRPLSAAAPHDRQIPRKSTAEEAVPLRCGFGLECGYVSQQVEDIFPMKSDFPAQWDPKLGIHVT